MFEKQTIKVMPNSDITFEHPQASFEKEAYNFWFESGLIEVPIECQTAVTIELKAIDQFVETGRKVNTELITEQLEIGFNLCEIRIYANGHPSKDHCFRVVAKKDDIIISQTLVWLRKTF